jgi:diaminopimelate epimerase
MLIPFTKMHGLGNDYVIIDERDEDVIPEDDKENFARSVCQRGFSVGSDGVLYLSIPEEQDIQMRIFNADGSEAESCGNGLRCAAFYHHGLHKPGESEFTINLPLAEPVEAVVDYEEPPFAHVRIELNQAGVYEGEHTVDVAGKTLSYHRVDVGNPHAVFFLEENDELPGSLDEIDLTEIGPPIQSHADFEDTGGINAEFVVVDEPGESVSMRVHERGVGETASCGTGCIGIARASAETGRASGWVDVNQPGGTLRIETNKGYLAGPATLSYTGEFRYRPQ